MPLALMWDNTGDSDLSHQILMHHHKIQLNENNSKKLH